MDSDQLLYVFTVSLWLGLRFRFCGLGFKTTGPESDFVFYFSGINIS